MIIPKVKNITLVTSAIFLSTLSSHVLSFTLSGLLAGLTLPDGYCAYQTRMNYRYNDNGVTRTLNGGIYTSERPGFGSLFFTASSGTLQSCVNSWINSSTLPGHIANCTDAGDMEREKSFEYLMNGRRVSGWVTKTFGTGYTRRNLLCSRFNTAAASGVRIPNGPISVDLLFQLNQNHTPAYSVCTHQLGNNKHITSSLYSHCGWDDSDGNDGYPDHVDNCPYDGNPSQHDFDNDDIGDVCDPDIDNDGHPNSYDACDYDANCWLDVDGDRTPRNIDTDEPALLTTANIVKETTSAPFYNTSTRASKAIDGTFYRKTNVFTDLMHTNNGTTNTGGNPYWEVEFKTAVDVEHVFILGGHNPSKAHNTRIMYLDKDDNIISQTGTLTNDHFGSDNAAFITKAVEDVWKVRLQKRSTDYLVTDEILVFGELVDTDNDGEPDFTDNDDDDDGRDDEEDNCPLVYNPHQDNCVDRDLADHPNYENYGPIISTNKQATQKSTYIHSQYPANHFAAGRAIDGEKTHRTSTHYGRNNWWQVDLGQPEPIGLLEVYSHSNSAIGDNVHNYDIIFLNEDSEEIHRIRNIHGEGIYRKVIENPNPLAGNIPGNIPAAAQFVRVQLNHLRNPLNLVEVEVRRALTDNVCGAGEIYSTEDGGTCVPRDSDNDGHPDNQDVCPYNANHHSLTPITHHSFYGHYVTRLVLDNLYDQAAQNSLPGMFTNYDMSCINERISIYNELSSKRSQDYPAYSNFIKASPLSSAERGFYMLLLMQFEPDEILDQLIEFEYLTTNTGSNRSQPIKDKISNIFQPLTFSNLIEFILSKPAIRQTILQADENNNDTAKYVRLLKRLVGYFSQEHLTSGSLQSLANIKGITLDDNYIFGELEDACEMHPKELSIQDPAIGQYLGSSNPLGINSQYLYDLYTEMQLKNPIYGYIVPANGCRNNLIIHYNSLVDYLANNKNPNFLTDKLSNPERALYLQLLLDYNPEHLLDQIMDLERQRTAIEFFSIVGNNFNNMNYVQFFDIILSHTNVIALIRNDSNSGSYTHLLRRLAGYFAKRNYHLDAIDDLMAFKGLTLNTHFVFGDTSSFCNLEESILELAFENYKDWDLNHIFNYVDSNLCKIQHFDDANDVLTTLGCTPQEPIREDDMSDGLAIGVSGFIEAYTDVLLPPGFAIPRHFPILKDNAKRARDRLFKFFSRISKHGEKGALEWLFNHSIGKAIDDLEEDAIDHIYTLVAIEAFLAQELTGISISDNPILCQEIEEELIIAEFVYGVEKGFVTGMEWMVESGLEIVDFAATFGRWGKAKNIQDLLQLVTTIYIEPDELAINLINASLHSYPTDLSEGIGEFIGGLIELEGLGGEAAELAKAAKLGTDSYSRGISKSLKNKHPIDYIGHDMSYKDLKKLSDDIDNNIDRLKSMYPNEQEGLDELKNTTKDKYDEMKEYFDDSCIP